MNIVHLVFVAAVLHLSHSYVLLQVRKGENHSNVDALIHKVVPAKKLDKMAETARKHLKNYNNIKTRGNDVNMDNVFLAINTGDDGNGDYQNGGKKYSHSDYRQLVNILTDIKNAVMDFIDTDIHRRHLKSKEENRNDDSMAEPNLIKIKTDKPVLYEIETTSLLKGIKDVLDSKHARRYSDKIAKTAAYMYSLINDA